MEDEFSEKKVEAQLGTPDSKVYEAAICFARIWGVMETLEPLPNIGFEEVRDIAITLAKEYVSENGKDLEIFLRRGWMHLKESTVYKACFDSNRIKDDNIKR